MKAGASSSGPVGSFEWLEQSGGILTAPERARLIARTYCCVLPKALAHRALAELWRRRSSRGSIDMQWKSTPRSTLASRAEGECHGSLTPSMVNHSYRTWVFGRALAHVDGIAVDEELLFVAAMLHDVGLARPTAGRCFTMRGAELSAGLPTDGQRTPADLVGAADAIAHHITPGLTERAGGTLGYYLQGGSALDLGGLRAIHLPVDFVSEVCDHWPVLEVKREAGALWRAESATVKHGRAHLLERWTRFSLASRFAPLPPRR